MRSHHGSVAAAFATIALLAGTASTLTAQTTTVPANYHGPTVVGFCFYTQPAAVKTQNDAVSYAGPITISNYFRFDAERAFRQYAATHAPTAQNITCRWASQQQYATATDKGFHATDRAGHPMKATQTGWQYTPGSGGMTNSAATTNASPLPRAPQPARPPPRTLRSPTPPPAPTPSAKA